LNYNWRSKKKRGEFIYAPKYEFAYEECSISISEIDGEKIQYLERISGEERPTWQQQLKLVVLGSTQECGRRQEQSGQQ
jgi:hypothetical protein